MWLAVRLWPSPSSEGLRSSVGIPIRIMGVNTARGPTTPSPSTRTARRLRHQPQLGTPVISRLTGPTSTRPTTRRRRPRPPVRIRPIRRVPPHGSHWRTTPTSWNCSPRRTSPPILSDQAIEEATTLYFMSNGVYNTNAYVGQTTINGRQLRGKPGRRERCFHRRSHRAEQHYPTARTLSNIINSATVTAVDGRIHELDLRLQLDFTKGSTSTPACNYDSELGNIISTQFGFPRLERPTPPDCRRSGRQHHGSERRLRRPDSGDASGMTL